MSRTVERYWNILAGLNTHVCGGSLDGNEAANINAKRGAESHIWESEPSLAIPYLRCKQEMALQGHDPTNRGPCSVVWVNALCIGEESGPRQAGKVSTTGLPDDYISFTWDTYSGNRGGAGSASLHLFLLGSAVKTAYRLRQYGTWYNQLRL